MSETIVNGSLSSSSLHPPAPASLSVAGVGVSAGLALLLSVAAEEGWALRRIVRCSDCGEGFMADQMPPIVDGGGPVEERFGSPWIRRSQIGRPRPRRFQGRSRRPEWRSIHVVVWWFSLSRDSRTGLRGLSLYVFIYIFLFCFCFCVSPNVRDKV